MPLSESASAPVCLLSVRVKLVPLESMKPREPPLVGLNPRMTAYLVHVPVAYVYLPHHCVWTRGNGCSMPQHPGREDPNDAQHPDRIRKRVHHALQGGSKQECTMR